MPEFWEMADARDRERLNARKPESIAASLASLLSDTPWEEIQGVIGHILKLASDAVPFDVKRANEVIYYARNAKACKDDGLPCECAACRAWNDRTAQERGI